MMLVRSESRKKLYLFLIIHFMLLLSASGAEEQVANKAFIYQRANISETYIHYDKIIFKYGELWIGYKGGNTKITTTSGHDRFILDEVGYFYKRDDNYCLLGSMDKTGLYDKDGICLKPANRIAVGFRVAGLSSAMLDGGAMSPTLILQSVTNNDIYRETDTFVLMDFDIERDSLMLLDMSQFLQ